MKISTCFVAAISLLVFACETPPKDANVDDNRDGVKKDPLASTSEPADSSKMPAPKLSASPSNAVPVTPPTPVGSSSPTPSDSAGLGISGSKSSACTTDADCRTFASYCPESPCACRVLPKGEPDPTCVGAGSKVQCLVNPCAAKVAHCQASQCVLVARQPSNAPTNAPTK